MSFSQNKPHAIIIGAGVSGLACAARLCAKGYDVTVYEAQSQPGGKISEIVKDGYHFNIGPNLFTEPTFLEELFKDCGHSLSSFLSYQRLPIIAKYFFSDAISITAWADKDKFIQEASIKTTEQTKHLERLFKKGKSLYESASLDGYKKPLSLLKQLSPLASSVHSANEKILKTRKTQQIFDLYATYAGSNPYRAPEVLNSLPYIEHELGVYYPKGGIRQIVEALVGLCTKMGVHIEYNSPVETILLNNSSKTTDGVVVKGQTIKAAIVVSNIDVYYTYKNLLKELDIPEKTYAYEPSSSMIMFCWGVKKTFPQLHVHNVFMSRYMKEEFETIFEDKTIFQDPTVHLHVTSKINSADAPAGCENWVATIAMPADTKQDWDDLVKQARDQILAKLHMLLSDTVQSYIVSEEVLTPLDFQSLTGAWRGALYGPGSNSLSSIHNRQPNVSKEVANLYFCGGTVYPGAGIAACLKSAKIVSEKAP